MVPYRLAPEDAEKIQMEIEQEWQDPELHLDRAVELSKHWMLKIEAFAKPSGQSTKVIDVFRSALGQAANIAEVREIIERAVKA